MKPLLTCIARNGSNDEKDNEINKLINVMFQEHDLTPEQFKTDYIDKIKRYIKLWSQAKIEDDGSDDE